MGYSIATVCRQAVVGSLNMRRSNLNCHSETLCMFEDVASLWHTGLEAGSIQTRNTRKTSWFRYLSLITRLG